MYDDTLNEGNDWDEGDHYLQLSNREEEMLQMVCENFDKVIVLINTNNAMELGFLEEYGVDAADLHSLPRPERLRRGGPGAWPAR